MMQINNTIKQLKNILVFIVLFTSTNILTDNCARARSPVRRRLEFENNVLRPHTHRARIRLIAPTDELDNFALPTDQELETEFVSPQWFFDYSLSPSQYRQHITQYAEDAPQFAGQLTLIRDSFVTPGRQSDVRKTFNKLNQRCEHQLNAMAALIFVGFVVGYSVNSLIQPVDDLLAKSAGALATIPFLMQASVHYKKAKNYADLKFIYAEHILIKMNRSTPDH